MNDNPLVVFLFAGRRANMEVQMPYLHAILDQHPEAQVHLWDLTRDPMDSRYLSTLDGAHEGRIRVLRHLHPGHPVPCLYPQGWPGSETGGGLPRGWRPCECLIHKPPYESPYRWYASRPEYADTVFLKVDDDVLFLETARLDDLLSPLAEHPDRVISADVVNNAVCAKYNLELVSRFEALIGDPTNPANDRGWWMLHTLAGFARISHEWFLDEWTTRPGPLARSGQYIRTRSGEAISINCIAFTSQTMRGLASQFEHNPRLGDEGAVDQLLPWIAKGFTAAHLTFGPQEAQMTGDELDGLRKRYSDLRRGYLGE